jgi:hypothetical protein
VRRGFNVSTTIGTGGIGLFVCWHDNGRHLVVPFFLHKKQTRVKLDPWAREEEVATKWRCGS